MMLIMTIVALTGGTAETTSQGAAAGCHRADPAGASYLGPGTRHRPPTHAAIRRPRSQSPWNTQTSTS
jgi:hypothetical protein